jgi:hypothetical protein
MNPMKRAGLKLFGPCVLALGLVAFSASVAQAEGTWMYKKTDVIASTPKVLRGKLKNNTGTLLSVIGVNKVDITCTAGELLNAFLEPLGGISEVKKNAKADFSGCSTKINGAAAPKCQPKATGKVAGTIETEEFYGLLKLHTTGEAVIVITPKTGNVIAVIHTGEACAIGEEVSVISDGLAFKDVGGNTGLLTEKVIHEFEEFKPLTTLLVGNIKSVGTGTLDGIGEIELTTGEVWNGLYE